jgi:hypothetical protein
VLERSPGSCTGFSGSMDDDVRAPTDDPVDDAPTGPDEDEADAFDVGTFNGSEAQADPARALPADAFDGEQPVPFKLASRGTGGVAAAAGLAAAVGTALPGAWADGEFVCACAAPIAASHRIIARVNERCIAFSLYLIPVKPGATPLERQTPPDRPRSPLGGRAVAWFLISEPMTRSRTALRRSCNRAKEYEASRKEMPEPANRIFASMGRSTT